MHDNTNRWALFINKKKEKETQPDMKWTVNIEWVEYYISWWSKKNDNVWKYLSISLQIKEENNKVNAMQPDSENDDLPF